ncbi:hypothetical protein MAJ_07310, partial [Metarhizium majus ARSEF 297]
MKYLNIFTACAGLAIAVPTLNPRQTKIDETDQICKTRGFDKDECKYQKEECQRTGKVELDQLINCLKVIDKTCVNDNECGHGFKCEQPPILLLDTPFFCLPKIEQSQAGKQESASPAKEQTQNTNGNVATPSPQSTEQPIDLNGKNPFFGVDSSPQSTEQPIDLNGKNPFFGADSSPQSTEQPIDLNGKNPFFGADSSPQSTEQPIDLNGKNPFLGQTLALSLLSSRSI